MDWFPLLDWLYTTIIGFLVVTYWRCTWVLMDIGLCDQHSDADLAGGDSFCYAIPAICDDEFATMRHQTASLSYIIGIVCLVVGVTMMWMGLWLPNSDNDISTKQNTDITLIVSIRRFFILYILGFSCVNIWRGIWYWADDWILPDNPVASYWTCSLVGAGVAFLLQGGNSLLAPPAIFLLDGPGLSPPPIAVTLLSSHYEVVLPYDEEPPELGLVTKILDILLSFGLLPFAVVWFWRGTWLLFDNYFYGFTPNVEDVYWSLLWNTIFAIIAIGLMSEPVIGRLTNSIPSDPEKTSFCSNCMNASLLRLRTYILAWGTVSFWRVVWLIWDEFLGGTTILSCCLGHFLSIAILMVMGCLSCITAPASTMGVDSVPHPMAADAPLFANVPVPYELLTLFGIGRQPPPDHDNLLYDDEVSRSQEKMEAPSQAAQVLHKIDEGADEDAPGSSSMMKKSAGGAESGGEGGGEEIEMVPTSGGEGEDDDVAKRQSYFTESGEGGGTAARRPRNIKPPPKGGKYSSRTASAPPRVEGAESKLQYLAKRSYGEMQRPGVGSSRKCYSATPMRPSDDNKRNRSKFFRSR